MGKKRVLEHKISRLLSMFPALAIIGPRQCGKSTLSKMCCPSWKYYDLERPDDYNLITRDPLSFFSLNSKNLIIDEAQQYPDLFKVLRSIVDENRSQKGRFILTGSSSPEIVKGLTESLAGRVATIEMAPFKAIEFFDRPLPSFYDLLIDKDTKIDDFENLDSQLSTSQMLEFWFTGGYPEPIISNDEVFRKQWLENYFSSYFDRDIRRLFPKLNIHSFRRFITLLTQQSGTQLNHSDIARSLEISNKTVKDYLDIVHNTFIWRNLPPFEKNSLKKVQKSNRGFFRDSGVLHGLLKINSLDELLVHPVAGSSFESFVIEEIIRGLKATMETGLDFNYYRTIDKSEIDLIIDGSNGYIPVEVKLGSSTSKKSLKGLENFLKDTKSSYGILINNAKRVEKLADNIIQIPVGYL